MHPTRNPAIAGLSQRGYLTATSIMDLETVLGALETARQTDDARRGRVMAFFSMAFQGMMPLGSLLAGAAAQTRLGAPGTVIVGGVCCLAVSAAYWAFRAKR